MDLALPITRMTNLKFVRSSSISKGEARSHLSERSALTPLNRIIDIDKGHVQAMFIG